MEDSSTTDSKTRYGPYLKPHKAILKQNILYHLQLITVPGASSETTLYT